PDKFAISVSILASSMTVSNLSFRRTGLPPIRMMSAAVGSRKFNSLTSSPLLLRTGLCDNRTVTGHVSGGGPDCCTTSCCDCSPTSTLIASPSVTKPSRTGLFKAQSPHKLDLPNASGLDHLGCSLQSHP